MNRTPDRVNHARALLEAGFIALYVVSLLALAWAVIYGWDDFCRGVIGIIQGK